MNPIDVFIFNTFKKIIFPLKSNKHCLNNIYTGKINACKIPVKNFTKAKFT